MVELLDQLEVLDPDANPEVKEGIREEESFQHYATLYIRYLQIFRKLEESYDQLVHPQKRMDVKKALDAVIGRVLEVKELLIKLNRGVPSVNLDDVLVDLKLAPEVLEVPVPRFFIEDQAHALAEREKLLDVLLLQAGLTDKKKGKDARDDTLMTLESAIRTVQLNERGRQGRQRAKFMKDIRSQEDRDRRLMEKKEEEREPEYASVLIQQNWRGYISRKRTNEMRAEELIFIGMAPPPRKPRDEDPVIKAVEVKQRRKLIQAQHEDEYREALVTLDREVYENEGPDMKEEMMDQLRDWCAFGTRLGRQDAQPSPFTSHRPAPSLPAGTSSFASARAPSPTSRPRRRRRRAPTAAAGRRTRRTRRTRRGRATRKTPRRTAARRGRRATPATARRRRGRRRTSSTC